MENNDRALAPPDRAILSFFATQSIAANAAVVAVNTGFETEVVKERMRRLREAGYVRTHGYFERLYKITDAGERALSGASGRTAHTESPVEPSR